MLVCVLHQMNHSRRLRPPLTLRVLGRSLRVGDQVDGGGGDVSRDSSLAPQEMPPEFQGRGLVALQTLQ